ncbi:hypothetical protein FEM48_Zijuj08G0147900 [Ziziphus jujuba var. spinosa]|uniref:Uncharacterized protein n=1 Tax=Ziziphus jujuba var. spinosa TaxID=714518 RepID=A0A978UZR0_ZIZJJ|nr:hypothetical protein FEM48_Zijuj08G0147900 [Ziziphus jujuba var. spinosa]
MANPYRSSEGLNARPLPTSDEIQLRIDPLQGDLDDQITGLHTQVRRLKSEDVQKGNNLALLRLLLSVSRHWAVVLKDGERDEWKSAKLEHDIDICICDEQFFIGYFFKGRWSMYIRHGFSHELVLNSIAPQVAQEIEAETKVQNDIISDLVSLATIWAWQMALSQAGDGVKNGMRRLRKVTQQSSNHIVHAIIFGLILFSFIYMLSKLARR